MFAEVVSGFSALFDREPFLFICRDVAETPKFIEKELARMALRPVSYQIVVLDKETTGQAETVYQGLKAVNVPPDTPLTIFNIDSQRRDFHYPSDFDLDQIDGYLEVFKGKGDHWSFVRPEGGGGRPLVAAEVAEKTRISELCSTGLYFFRRAGLFFNLFEGTLSKNVGELQGGERYVAPLYDIAIKRGYDIRYAVIPEEALSFTGTPDEYDAINRQTGPKVAFCLGGQVRGPADHLKAVGDLARALGADVFVSTWQGRGRKTFSGASGTSQLRRLFGAKAAVLFPKGFLFKMEKVFPEIQRELEKEGGSVLDELRAAFPDAALDVEQPDVLNLDLETNSGDHNSLRMLYKIWRCNRMKREAEKKKQRKYDYVIRFRPDCLPDARGFLASRVEDETPWFPSGGMGKDFVHDIFWMTTSEQDDYLAGLFGLAAEAPGRPWTNIHIELLQRINAKMPDWSLATPPVHYIRDDTTSEEKTYLLQRIIHSYHEPSPALKAILPDPADREALAEVMQLSLRPADDYASKLEACVDGGIQKSHPAVCRGLLVLALHAAPGADEELRNSIVDMIERYFELESGAGQPLKNFSMVLRAHVFNNTFWKSAKGSFEPAARQQATEWLRGFSSRLN
jgi:hypothetical protein